ncbi:hypothetical protein BU15DRAFT_84034 [Melanogaster broomeanus]|nr:hypothetical protein BU15DRAFT_84034 [Melanogaster broomeanus]
MSSPRLRVPLLPPVSATFPMRKETRAGRDLVGPLAPVLQPNPIHPALQRFGEQTETIATICASDYKTQEDGPWDATRRQPPCNCMEAASQRLPLSHLAIRSQRFPAFLRLGPVLSLSCHPGLECLTPACVVVNRRVTAWKQLPNDCLCRTSPSVHRDPPRSRALARFSLSCNPGLECLSMWSQSPPSESFPVSLPSLRGSHTPALAAPARASSRQVLVSQSSPTLREPLQPMVPSLFAALS